MSHHDKNKSRDQSKDDAATGQFTPPVFPPDRHMTSVFPADEGPVSVFPEPKFSLQRGSSSQRSHDDDNASLSDRAKSSDQDSQPSKSSAVPHQPHR